LDQCFAEIETIAADASLSECSLKKIKKAKKVVVDMVATIVFFISQFKGRLKFSAFPRQSSELCSKS
jgi:hypothetical protein